MTRSIKELRRFDTLAPDGTVVPVIEFQWVETRRDINGNLVKMESPVLLGLTDGTQVLPGKDKTYQVYGGGILREIEKGHSD
jgi:hypothetical protein